MNGERSNDSEEIEALVAETLDRMEAEGSGALDRVCADNPRHADALRVRVEWLLEAGLADVPTPKVDVPERLGDFRLGEPLGEGGMGVVYRAEQVSLGREVALKLVRPEQLYFPGAVDRFQREVNTVAALSHPGIVPVFAVGEENGIPFFAMERIRGSSLHDALRRLQGRDPRSLSGKDLVQALDGAGADPNERASSLFEGPWPTVCARLAREVAEALEHAHRRDVLHRDVKPSNVMLTRGGRVMLVDFGLSSSERGPRRRTRTGVAVGTLAYMAPEQRRGERELDARVDVYALGVTLYELLTLRLPFETGAKGGEPDGGVPANLRKIDPRISWELETVVQAATDPDVDRRYASAADFAHDLSCVLESRPIEARRASGLLRARRWVQRHPAAALAGLFLAVGPSIFAWQQLEANRVVSAKNVEIEDANDRLGDALTEVTLQRDAADDARRRSERNFERAFEAVELMLGRVGGEVLAGVPRMDSIRRGLLTDALRLHEELLAEQAGDRTQRDRFALTLERAAGIHGQLGQLGLALERVDQAADVIEELLAEDPSQLLRQRRARLEVRRAEAHRLREEFAAAEAAARDAVERFSGLVAEDPRSDFTPDWLRGRARALLELTDVLVSNGDVPQGRAVARRAADDMRDVLALRPGGWEERGDLAEALYRSASPPPIFLLDSDSAFVPERDSPLLEEALELWRELSAERPDDLAALNGVATAAMDLGMAYSGIDRYSEAYELLDEARECFERLNREFPSRPMYADALGGIYLNSSQVAALTGRTRERQPALENAVRMFEGLMEDYPENRAYQRRLALALGQLGHFYYDPAAGRDAARAVPVLERSLELGVPLLDDGGLAEGLRISLSWTTGVLGYACHRSGDASAVADAARRYEDLDPTPVEEVYAAGFLVKAVDLALAGDRSVSDDTITAWREEALDLLERAAERDPEDPELLREMVDPTFGPLADEPRYVELLDYLGIER